MPHPWRRLAIAGNSAVLVLLVFVLLHGALLIENSLPSSGVVDRHQQAQCGSCVSGEAAQRLLFIVVDGLRLDYAADPQLMPHLVRLAAAGGSGVARVESLIPSTVAAIQTFVTGQVTPAISFLQDFTARRAPHGGLFAALGNRHEQIFVAGPRLWTDLYGDWITTAVSTEQAGDSGMFQAGLDALAWSTHRLLVVHFGHPDAAGHRYGTASQAYAQAIAWCDAAIAELVAQAGDHTAVIVVADHGATAQGGHAGPEVTVRQTPVVTWGPGLPRGNLGTIRQRDIPELTRQALGLGPAVVPATAAPRPVPWPLSLIIAAVAVGCGMRVWAGVAGGGAGYADATALGAAPWLVLPLALGGAWRLALCLALLTLVVTAWRVATRTTWELPGVLGAGALFGAMRLVDGLLTDQAAPSRSMVWEPVVNVSGVALVALVAGLGHIWPWHRPGATSPSSWPVVQALQHGAPRWLLASSMLAIVAYTVGGMALPGGYGLLLVLGIGLSIARPVPRAMAFYTGLASACIPVALVRLLGETVSLSTLDLRVAFPLLEGPGGVPAAVTVVAVRHAIPVWGLLLGLFSIASPASALSIGRFAAGLAAATVGQALPAAWLFTVRGTDPVLGSLALGALLRLSCEISYGFLGSALALWLMGRRAPAFSRRLSTHSD